MTSLYHGVWEKAMVLSRAEELASIERLRDLEDLLWRLGEATSTSECAAVKLSSAQFIRLSKSH